MPSKKDTASKDKEKDKDKEKEKEKDKESSKWWFRNKKHTSQMELRKTKHTPVFGAKLDEIMQNQKSEHPELKIPYLLILLKSAIVKLDGYHTEGIFRVPGNATDVINYKKQFDDGNYEMATDNVHTPAAIFKLWLREMPEPVFPYALYEKCLVATTPAAALEMVEHLPEANQNVLRFVINLLREVSQPHLVTINKMGIDNLAMVFAPCLLRSLSSNPASLLENSTKEKEFIVLLIENLPISKSDLPPDLEPANHSLVDSADLSASGGAMSTTGDQLSTSGGAMSVTGEGVTMSDVSTPPGLGDGTNSLMEEEDAPVRPEELVPRRERLLESTSSLIEDDEPHSPALVLTSVARSNETPANATVNESHRVRVQLLANAIASNITAYLQTNLHSNVTYDELRISSKHIDDTLKKLDDFVKKELGMPPEDLERHHPTDGHDRSVWTHSAASVPSLSLSSLDPSEHSKAQKRHEAITKAATRLYDNLHALARRAELSKSPMEVGATKKFLKNLKKELEERPAENGVHEEANGGGAGNGEGNVNGERERDGEGTGGEEADAVAILRSLETHIAAKRALLESNEDTLDAEAAAALTEKRMALARAISPVKKELDNFCKDCNIELVPDSRYPVDDDGSELKFLRKMILHVIARICYLTQEGVSYIQQQTDHQLAQRLHQKLAKMVDLLA